MSWVKLDDGFPTHPKVIGLSDRAFRAHIAALCYSAQHLTDGFVPPECVKQREAVELMQHGLWLPSDARSGYVIRDYLEYNPSREKVLTERRRAAERRARVGRTSGDEPPTVSDPDPTPTPSPGSDVGSEASAPTARRATAPRSEKRTEFGDDWLYLLDQLTEKGWDGLSKPILGKLLREYGFAAVDGALREAHGFTEAPPLRAEPYLESICVRIHAEGAA